MMIVPVAAVLTTTNTVREGVLIMGVGAQTMMVVKVMITGASVALTIKSIAVEVVNATNSVSCDHQNLVLCKTFPLQCLFILTTYI